MLEFKKEYFQTENNRHLYPTTLDISKAEVYGCKEREAFMYKIPNNYYTSNAGNIDFSLYPNGVWNDYTAIKIVERLPFFQPSINFNKLGDITPSNLNKLKEEIKKHIVDLETAITESVNFIDSGVPGQNNLPYLPEGCVWFRDPIIKDVIALPITDLYEKFGNLIKAMEKILDEYIEQKKEEIRGPAGAIDNVTASVNSNAGTPKVTVSLGGTPERRKIDLKFENLKGDKPIKGTDYYTEEEKQQFTTETLSLVTDEGNKQISLTQAEALKVIEQLKKLVEGNPATSNAQTLSGKTRVEFEQDTENLRNDCNENLGNFKIISGHALAGDYKWIELNQNVAENTTVYIDSYINSTKSYTIALYSNNDGTRKELASFVNDNVRFTIPYFTKKLEAVISYIPEEVDYKFIYREIKDKTIFRMILENQDNHNNLKNVVDKNSKELKEKLYVPYLNLIDKNKCELSKSIYQGDGETRESEFFNATDYILLRANTKYYGFGMLAISSYAFYDVDTKQFLNSADVKVTKTSSDYNCTIEVFGSDVYFRCSINKSHVEKSYISQYIDSYYQYGEYDTSFISKIHQEKIKVLEDKNKVLEDKVNSITKTGENLIDKKVLVIGDSISTDDYGNYKKWVTHLIEEGFFNKANVTNSSFHATGFVADYIEGDYHSGTFIERLTKITEKETYDLVIIFGGINDFIDPRQNIEWTMFTGAVDNFFEYLINNFTQARICVLRPLRTYNIYPNIHTKKLQQEYSEYINTVAKKYCLPVLNLTEDSGFCPFVDSFNKKWTLIPKGFNSNDGVHPNEQYEKEFLAPMIKKFLLNLG